MNKLFLTGRIVRDAIAGATQKGSGYIAFTIAVDRDYKNADGTVSTDFISVMESSKNGETASKFASYLKKGTAVEIIGSLRSKTVEKDGQKTTELSVVADSVRFALTNTSKSDSAPTTTAPVTTTASTTSTTSNVVQDVVTDDDLPF